MIERMRIMSQKIKLSAPEDVKEFVKAANKCDFDIDISYNRVLLMQNLFWGFSVWI